MNRLFANFVSGPAAVGLLCLRLIWGLAMVLHGLPKMGNPFGWMDGRGPSGVPGILQALAAFSEFGGGVAIMLGLLTPIAAFGLLCTMAVATWTHLSRGDSFVKSHGAPGGSYEPALVYLGIALLLLLVGPGRLSLDHLIFNRRRTGFTEPLSPTAQTTAS